MRFDVITLLPELVESVVQVGVTGRASQRKLIELHCWNPRDFTKDVHRTVDDRPYGGGPGMVMKADCLLETIRAVRAATPEKTKLVYLSPQGEKLEQSMFREVSHDPKIDSLILLCGRYEGIDERVIQLEVDEEWSLGDYVLSGGELGAMVVIDAITRLLPSVLGHKDSAEQDSFTENLLDCGHFTRPESIENLDVPAVLKSGDHKAITRWRRKQSLGRTYQRRDDLIERNTLSVEDSKLLNEYLKENN
ncbi:MAG: tRNA (guanine37-N1)-methyltransferase [Cocleimonas sp.]|jgi:tRNA (guanine37-N1)-methyltransferase